MKVWESHFVPSHPTSKVSNFTHFQSINQTNNHNNLFNITFQNLEFWDVTNLPHLKWISSSRFEEASKKRLGFGGLPANPSTREVWGATTLESNAMVLTKFMYSILSVDGVGLLIFSGITLSLVLSRSGHDLFLKILCPLNPGEVLPKSGSSYLTCLLSILRNYRNLLAVNNLWLLL